MDGYAAFMARQKKEQEERAQNLAARAAARDDAQAKAARQEPSDPQEVARRQQEAAEQQAERERQETLRREQDVVRQQQEAAARHLIQSRDALRRQAAVQQGLTSPTSPHSSATSQLSTPMHPNPQSAAPNLPPPNESMIADIVEAEKDPAVRANWDYFNKHNPLPASNVPSTSFNPTPNPPPAANPSMAHTTPAAPSPPAGDHPFGPLRNYGDPEPPRRPVATSPFARIQNAPPTGSTSSNARQLFGAIANYVPSQGPNYNVTSVQTPQYQQQQPNMAPLSGVGTNAQPNSATSNSAVPAIPLFQPHMLGSFNNAPVSSSGSQKRNNPGDDRRTQAPPHIGRSHGPGMDPRPNNLSRPASSAPGSSFGASRLGTSFSTVGALSLQSPSGNMQKAAQPAPGASALNQIAHAVNARVQEARASKAASGGVNPQPNAANMQNAAPPTSTPALGKTGRSMNSGIKQSKIPTYSCSGMSEPWVSVPVPKAAPQAPAYTFDPNGVFGTGSAPPRSQPQGPGYERKIHRLPKQRTVSAIGANFDPSDPTSAYAAAPLNPGSPPNPGHYSNGVWVPGHPPTAAFYPPSPLAGPNSGLPPPPTILNPPPTLFGQPQPQPQMGPYAAPATTTGKADRRGKAAPSEKIKQEIKARAKQEQEVNDAVDKASPQIPIDPAIMGEMLGPIGAIKEKKKASKAGKKSSQTAKDTVMGETPATLAPAAAQVVRPVQDNDEMEVETTPYSAPIQQLAPPPMAQPAQDVDEGDLATAPDAMPTPQQAHDIDEGDLPSAPEPAPISEPVPIPMVQQTQNIELDELPTRPESPKVELDIQMAVGTAASTSEIPNILPAEVSQSLTPAMNPLHVEVEAVGCTSNTMDNGHIKSFESPQPTLDIQKEEPAESSIPIPNIVPVEVPPTFTQDLQQEEAVECANTSEGIKNVQPVESPETTLDIQHADAVQLTNTPAEIETVATPESPKVEESDFVLPVEPAESANAPSDIENTQPLESSESTPDIQLTVEPAESISIPLNIEDMEPLLESSPVIQQEEVPVESSKPSWVINEEINKWSFAAKPTLSLPIPAPSAPAPAPAPLVEDEPFSTEVSVIIAEPIPIADHSPCTAKEAELEEIIAELRAQLEAYQESQSALARIPVVDHTECAETERHLRRENMSFRTKVNMVSGEKNAVESQVDQVSRELKAVKDSLSDPQKAVQSLCKKWSKSTQKLEVKVKEIGDLNEKLKVEKNGAAKVVNAMVQKAKVKIDSKTSELGRTESQLKQRGEHLIPKEAALDKREQELFEREEKLRKREEALIQAELDLEVKTAAAKLEVDVKSRSADDEIEAKRTQFESEKAGFETRHNARVMELNTKEGDFARKELHYATLMSLENKFDDMETDLLQKDLHIDGLTDELTKLKSTLAPQELSFATPITTADLPPVAPQVPNSQPPQVAAVEPPTAPAVIESHKWKLIFLFLFAFLAMSGLLLFRGMINSKSKSPSQSGTFNFLEVPVLQADACHVSLKQFAVPGTPRTPEMCIIDYDNYTIVSDSTWDIEHLTTGLTLTFGGAVDIDDEDGSEDAPVEKRPSKSWVWKMVVVGAACTIVGLAIARGNGAL